MTKQEQKIVFIDTSVFINCAKEEFEDLNIDILNDFLDKLEKDEMFLICPEIIKSETEFQIGESFKVFQEFIDTLSYGQKEDGKKSGVLKDILEGCKKSSSEEMSKRAKRVSIIIKEIFGHKNTIIVPLSDVLILAGMKRSLLMKRPFVSKGTKNDKSSSFAKDQDCVAFESFLFCLRENSKLKKLKNPTVIVCIDDIHYFTDEKKDILHQDIIEAIRFTKVLGYNSPLEMFKREFKKKYTKRQEEQYEDITRKDYSNGFQVVTIPGSFAANNFVSLDRGNMSLADWGSLSNRGINSSILIGDASSIKIPSNSKFCPFCGSDIKDLVKKKFTYVSLSYFFSKECVCPSCGAQLSLDLD